MSTPQYDLIVIGSGPAGEKGAAQAAYFGKKVALIEREAGLGGAAANTGTLPSKTLRETALYLSGFRQRGLFGVNMSFKDSVTARDFLFRERVVRETEQKRIMGNLQRHCVDLRQGFATLVDAHTVQVEKSDGMSEMLTGEFILLATGSRPFRPAVFPFDDPRVYDSDTILDLHDIPQNMLVVGGGVIGCEYACMFAALGIRVTLLEGRDRLLTFLDPEVAALLTRNMIEMGVDLRFQETVAAVQAGARDLEATLASGKKVLADTMLVAAGRSGNTDKLNLSAVGLAANTRGVIEVNAHYQTAVSNIYAAGDIVGFPALAATSMEQARVAMVHAFDLKYKTKVAPWLPYGIYTIPECSMVGETEESLTRKSIPYVAGTAHYAGNARGQIIGARHGFIKLLFARDDMKLLGVHGIGEQATELIHIGLVALQTGASAELFIETCFNYPTLGELYKYATYDALGRRAKLRGESQSPF
ncbi:MAG: Si-specific NAD(P)(+) transhydrogenase [Cephaloticoccus sp.]|nr:Si-specific NAD(P)(+) transhydrogenase [Cephaloticoccus sp.]MCF7761185.1 Si-specific NAD(P)(+) transhydrogenase [Cephaloticoccus sp.]